MAGTFLFVTVGDGPDALDAQHRRVLGRPACLLRVDGLELCEGGQIAPAGQATLFRRLFAIVDDLRRRGEDIEQIWYLVDPLSPMAVMTRGLLACVYMMCLHFFACTVRAQQVFLRVEGPDAAGDEGYQTLLQDLLAEQAPQIDRSFTLYQTEAQARPYHMPGPLVTNLFLLRAFDAETLLYYAQLCRLGSVPSGEGLVFTLLCAHRRSRRPYIQAALSDHGFQGFLDWMERGQTLGSEGWKAMQACLNDGLTAITLGLLPDDCLQALRYTLPLQEGPLPEDVLSLRQLESGLYGNQLMAVFSRIAASRGIDADALADPQRFTPGRAAEEQLLTLVLGGFLRQGVGALALCQWLRGEEAFAPGQWPDAARMLSTHIAEIDHCLENLLPDELTREYQKTVKQKGFFTRSEVRSIEALEKLQGIQSLRLKQLRLLLEKALCVWWKARLPQYAQRLRAVFDGLRLGSRGALEAVREASALTEDEAAGIRARYLRADPSDPQDEGWQSLRARLLASLPALETEEGLLSAVDAAWKTVSVRQTASLLSSDEEDEGPQLIAEWLPQELKTLVPPLMVIGALAPAAWSAFDEAYVFARPDLLSRLPDTLPHKCPLPGLDEVCLLRIWADPRPADIR